LSTVDGSAELDPFVPALEIRIVQSEATFELEDDPVGISGAGPHPTIVTVTTQRVILGRGPDAKLPLVGKAAKDVSRAHLVLEAFGGLWLLTDPGSTNGTEVQVGEADGKRSWRRVGASRLPIESGMVLLLANSVMLSFRLVRRSGLLKGPTTDRKSDRAGVHVGWIQDRKLEVVAEALLRHYRDGHPEQGAATVPQLMEWLDTPKRTVHRRLEELRLLPEIELLWHRTPDNLAEVLMHVYPYLLAPREGDAPRRGDDAVTSADG
jgi:hypothetical protein